MNNIFLIDNETELLDEYPKINLNTDIVFVFPEKSNDKLHFDFSGKIHFTFGENTNLSMIKTKNNSMSSGNSSTLRQWKIKPNFKISCPFGITPMIFKTENPKYFIDVNSSCEQYIGVNLSKIPDNFKIEDTIDKSYILYQDFEVVCTFDIQFLASLVPTLIIKPDVRIFDILLLKTFFSNDNYRNLYMIRNTEMFLNFKEVI